MCMHLGYSITYSHESGIIGIHQKSAQAGVLPDDLCFQLQVNFGEDWVENTEEEEDSDDCWQSSVKQIDKNLLVAQIRVLSCGRGFCSEPSPVELQGSRKLIFFWVV